eukprot:IDg9931t1
MCRTMQLHTALDELLDSVHKSPRVKLGMHRPLDAHNEALWSCNVSCQRTNANASAASVLASVAVPSTAQCLAHWSLE